jgi:hypothetical protein
MSDGGGSGLDAVDIFFIVLLLLYPGLCALGVLIIICKKVCGFCLSICSKSCGFCLSIFDKWSLSRNNSHRSSASRAPHVPSVPNVPDGPSETKPDRSEGDPRVCDVCITPWHPLCSQPDPEPGRLGLSRCRMRNANHTANARTRARWGGFLVSHVQSTPFVPGRCRVLTFCSWISSRCLRMRCPTRIHLFPHSERGAVAPPNIHHRPKSGSAPSFSCPSSQWAGAPTL